MRRARLMPRGVALAGLLLAAAACAGGAGSGAGVQPARAAGCAAGLCPDADALSSLARTAEQLAACRPDRDDHRGPPSGLRVGDVVRLDDEGGDRVLRVTIVNVSPRGVWSYPTAMLEVVGGDASVSTPWDRWQRSASVPAYGIEGCGTITQLFRVRPGEDPEVRLLVGAGHLFGDVVIDRIRFSLSR